jgi:uncharacterized membrane protein
VDRYDWLLFLHVTGAFLLVGGAVMAGVFNVAAMRRERPSEIAMLLRLTRYAVVSVTVGMFATLGFGIWLIHQVGYSAGDAWIVAAFVLWAVSGFLGGQGGRRERETRELAERLAAEGDSPTAELSARLRDPVILALMIWKPGA